MKWVDAPTVRAPLEYGAHSLKFSAASNRNFYHTQKPVAKHFALLRI
jgi:hypothetical protein